MPHVEEPPPAPRRRRTLGEERVEAGSPFPARCRKRGDPRREPVVGKGADRGLQGVDPVHDGPDPSSIRSFEVPNILFRRSPIMEGSPGKRIFESQKKAPRRGIPPGQRCPPFPQNRECFS